MAITESTSCDICGKLKGAVNCWWLIEDDGEHSFAVIPWSKSKSPELYSHVCGQECAGKFLSKWMQEQSK